MYTSKILHSLIFFSCVGMTWEEATARCPEGVAPACHNSKDSVTISGDPAALTKFVAQLQSEQIFARMVESSNVAFHSRYIADAGPKLKASLDKLIPEPKPRSSRWISSSVPKDKWDTALAKFSSAEYHVNNLLSPVLFKTACDQIPANVIVIEVAGHCLLQAILRRSLPGSVITGLMKKASPDNLAFCLTNIGK